jgi:secreted protein
MMKKILWLCLFFWGVQLSAQETDLQGHVYSVQNNKPMPNVHILNLNKVKGTTTNDRGDFTIKVSANDTLYISFLGYKSTKIRVTNDMMKFQGLKIGMTELAYALEEVVITPYKLTGYLDIDAKNAPINNNTRYSVSGLEIGYESRASASAVGRVLSAVMNPADLLHRSFSAKGKEMRKLREMRKDNQLSDALSTRYDRETLLELLQVSRSELEDIIRTCNYSNDFIMTANDLQVLEAISQCYEEYRVLHKKK